jgi:hypothetical protein
VLAYNTIVQEFSPKIAERKLGVGSLGGKSERLQVIAAESAQERLRCCQQLGSFLETEPSV